MNHFGQCFITWCDVDRHKLVQINIQEYNKLLISLRNVFKTVLIRNN